MKFQRNRFMFFAIIGLLCSLSFIYSSKIQARTKRKRKTPTTTTRMSRKRRTEQNQPKDIHIMEELDNHLKSGMPVVLMIHATFCGACKISMEPFADAAEDNVHVQFLKVEGDKEGREIADKYEIGRFPTFVLFDKQGTEKHKFSGGGSPSSVLSQKIKKYIG